MNWIVGIALVWIGNCISVTLTENVCFKVRGGQDYTVEFVVSGVNQRSVVFTVFRGSDLLMRSFNQSDYSKVIGLPSGEVRLCFEPTDNTYKQLTVDFFPTSNPIKNLVTHKDLGLVHRELLKLHDQLQERYRNQHFQSDRDEVHRNILEQTDEKIQWLGIFKVVFLIVSVVLQLWVMKGFVKNTGQNYNPVSS